MFATRSASCLYPSTRTIFRTSRSVVKARSSRASGVGICRAWLRAELQRGSFPCRQRANHLQEKKKFSDLSTKSFFKSLKPEFLNLPVGQYPSEKICELKSCCCSCLPSRRSHDLTVLSRPPVHNLEPSGLISMHEAPSVCPWNCRTSVLLFRSHTAMLPSLQHEKHTLESGEMAKA